MSKDSRGFGAHSTMETMASEMKLREEQPDQAREDHRGRMGIHAALLIFLLVLLFLVVRGGLLGVTG